MTDYGSTKQGEVTSSAAPNGAGDAVAEAPSPFPPRLFRAVPELNPVAWVVVNNSLAVSGCVLVAELWYANNYGTPLEERPFAQACVLVWEFLTCFFWTIESGLSAGYQHYHLREDLEWYMKLELAIAVYFAASTGWMLYRWQLMRYEESSVWEIALDTSFYVYLAARSCKRTNSADAGADDPAISLRDLEGLGNGGDTSYRRMESGQLA